MKNTAKSLWASVLALVLCVSMLLGTTFAWFTDSVSSDRNTISAGNLDVELEYLKDGAFTTVGSDTKVFDPNIKWEPGYTSLTCLRVTNAGTLALQYLLSITVEAGTAILGENGENLADVIKVYTCYGENTAADYEEIETSVLWQYEGTLTEVMRKPTDFLGGQLLPEGETPDANALATTKEKEQVLTIALHMEETAGNEYQKLSAGDIYVNLVATQWNDEMDGFGAGYDTDAIFPLAPGMLLYTSAPAVKDANGYLANALMLGADGDTGTASLPAGVKLADGADEVALQLSVIKNREAVVEMKGGDVAIPLDVHMVGVASDNDKPITVTLNGLFPKNYAQYNIRLFHVENGVTRAMTAVDSLADLDAHNEFYYDDATGTVTLAMATFSEVTAAVSAGNPWDGNAADISWYNTTDTEFTLMDAADFAGFAQIVGGMNGIARDDFAGKTVKLGADINMGGASSVNFAPVGYYYVADNGDGKPFSDVYSFSGTFDGQGYTISDVLQRTWDIKGDDPYYDLTKNHYYNDGMGIFGFVYNGTIKNLEVDNFQSDGEFSTTGCVAAYSAGVSTFENIRITNCNPRAYNVPNGGVVGYAYDEAEAAENAITFSNIIVDDSTKITALWGSWDVGCGGILGRMGNETKVTMTNCSVAAEIDVYNDVCGNYQYYQYRYSGMLIGTCGSDSDPSDQIANVTFTDCHVRYGDWAEYYYCELVANSLASYTHDHQMSRLEQVESVDTENMKVTSLKGVTTDIPTSGRVNYVVVKAKDANGKWIHGDGHGYAECYHFVNGVQHFHDVADADNPNPTETVNGVAGVLKEDKQLVYREFNNLVTGYGWGVTTKAVGDLAGVTILDRDVGDSEVKFNKADTAKDSYMTDTTITIGNLFAAANLNDDKLSIIDQTVSVTVSPVGEDSTASGVFTPNTTDWTKGTLTFSGLGAAVITITDYYFCESTTLNVTITEKTAVEKFEQALPEANFMYRVGNQNTVTLGTLFKEKDNVDIAIEGAKVEIGVSGVEATYTRNTSDWTNGTIKFNGTGIATVTITDNTDCKETSLKFEIVDAVNATTATSATANNVVLLNDCGFSSLDVMNGYTLYGNGFTLTCSNDSYASDLGYAFVTLDNGTLDNVQIDCPDFDYAALYKSNLTSNENRSYTDSTGKTRYYNARSGVMASGNSQILNSRISGARATVNIAGGNCVIDNSRIEGGAVASILVGAANSLTLRDVVLVQEPTESTYKESGATNGTTLMGFSVLYMCDSDGNATPTTIEGSFVQKAWVSENEQVYVPSGGESIIEAVLKKTEYLHDINDDGTNESLNLGFAYMPSEIGDSINTPGNITDSRSDKATIPYETVAVDVTISLAKLKLYVFSYKNSNGTDGDFVRVADYIPNKYGDIITVSYADTTEGIEEGKSFGTNGWIYELNVDLDKASGYALDFNKLSMTVNGIPVTDYKVDGNAKPADPISVTAGGTTYLLTATVNEKEHTVTLKVTGTETSKDSPSIVANDYEAGICVASSYGGTWHGAAPALEGIQIKYWSVAEQQYKTIKLSDYTPTEKGKLNGTNKTWSYSPDNGDFTLTLTGGLVHSSNNVYSMPVSVDTNSDGTADKLYFVSAASNGLVNSGNSARTISVSYSFNDNNNGDTLSFSHTWSVSENKGEQYKYSDFCNGTWTKLESSSSGGTCLAAGTLITLIGGEKKAVEDLRKGDIVMTLDHLTGEITYKDVIIVVKTHSESYYKNTFIFDDGTSLVTINEHGIFDLDLNKYVNIDHLNYQEFVGHRFVSIDTNGNIGVKRLVDVTTVCESGYKYDIVTNGTLNYVAEDTLSVTHVLVDVINSFDFGEDLMYDAEKMVADIEKYGLYTYDEWEAYCDISVFDQYNIPVMKVGISKGLYTKEYIIGLINTYVLDDSVQILD